jgi:hypothetical protein
MRETPSTDAIYSNAPPRKIFKIWVSDMEFPAFHSQDTIYSRLLHLGYCNQIAFTHHLFKLFNHKQPKQLMREINNTSRVSVRKYAEACVTRIMRETW